MNAEVNLTKRNDEDKGGFFMNGCIKENPKDIVDICAYVIVDLAKTGGLDIALLSTQLIHSAAVLYATYGEDKHQSGTVTDASMLAKTIEILKKEGGSENDKA